MILLRIKVQVGLKVDAVKLIMITTTHQSYLYSFVLLIVHL